MGAEEATTAIWDVTEDRVGRAEEAAVVAEEVTALVAAIEVVPVLLEVVLLSDGQTAGPGKV